MKGLILTVLLLGIRHGFDLDHIATIDAITRNIKNNPKLSNFIGFLFSLGHGAIVTAISIIICIGFKQWTPPLWFNHLGNYISLFFLLILGLLTLYNIVKTKQFDLQSLSGAKKHLFKNLINRANHPLSTCAIGALFAFSFDTFSQVALFSLAASSMQGWPFSLLLGITFTIGMMLSDGLNGLLMSFCIRRADNYSALLSRLLSIAIAAFSLIIGAQIILKMLN